MDARRMRSALVFVVTLASVASPTHAADPEPARGSVLLAPFKSDLQAALREGLAKGPLEALDACRVKAPEIARSLSHDGIRVGRASHRLRNPANAAPDWVRPLLDAYAEDPADRAPRTVELPGGRMGRTEPILVQPLCLTCHGKTLAPEVAARITALYPDDRATGYEVGDLRGVFWIEYPREE